MSINNIGNINPLAANLNQLLSTVQARPGLSSDAKEAIDSFASVLTESIENAALADKADKASALELLTGQSDDLSGLLLDAQKAELSLNLALQIRNKVIDAYNEIIRMSV